MARPFSHLSLFYSFRKLNEYFPLAKKLRKLKQYQSSSCSKLANGILGAQFEFEEENIVVFGFQYNLVSSLLCTDLIPHLALNT